MCRGYTTRTKLYSWDEAVDQGALPYARVSTEEVDLPAHAIYEGFDTLTRSS